MNNYLLSPELAGRIYDSRFERYLREWGELLAFESISTDAQYAKNCLACAGWLVEHLRSIGLEAGLLETSSKPVVWGNYRGRPEAPRVIFYGHYDVQPVEPLEDWVSPPFKATLRDGRLHARGAQDNKGQTFYVLKALETLIEQKALDCNVTLLIEGEEESGSKGIAASLSGWKDKIAGDVLLVCDTGALRAGVPCITMGLRGIVALEFTLGGLSHDLHSGVLGGVVKNPAIEITRLLSTLYADDGRIAVEGFYDGVSEPQSADRSLANASWIGDDVLQKMIGVEPCGGEPGYSSPERRGFRPTLEINGLNSGYSGPGVKTIIPSKASAKLTARVVPGQDPHAVLEKICEHLRKRVPRGLNFEIIEKGVGGPAVALSTQHPVVLLAAEVLQHACEGKVEYTWEGGSIPIVAELAKHSGAVPLLVGFGLEEDRIHAPNESFLLSQFRLGFLSMCLLLQALGRYRP